MVGGCRGAVFDLDGTLLDSMPVWQAVDRAFLEENGAEYTPEVSAALRKLSITEAVDFFRAHTDLSKSSDEEILNRISELAKRLYPSIRMKPYAGEYLTALRRGGVPMCAATANNTDISHSVLKRLGIFDFFKAVLTCEEVGKPKTKPDIYLRAAEILGTEPRETAVFEDALHCIETAKNSGFYVVGVFDEMAEDEWTDICNISDTHIMTFGQLTIDN